MAVFGVAKILSMKIASDFNNMISNVLLVLISINFDQSFTQGEKGVFITEKFNEFLGRIVLTVEIYVI